MGRRTRILGIGASVASCVVLGVVTVSAAGSTSDDPMFCTLGGRLGVGPGEVFGDLTILDHSGGNRTPCGDDDLWGFPPHELVGIDGVLFNDCVISWTKGGRTPADEVGVPCDA